MSFAALLSASAAGADEPPAPKGLVKADLVAETAAIAPGATLWVDFHLEVKPGWHVYWQNPGDSGLPTTLEWRLPPGFSAGHMLWPVPEHFVQNGIGNYGYSGAADLLVPITAPSKLSAGQTALLKTEASWLACADICIPGSAKLSLNEPVAAQPFAPDPAVAPLFAAARRQLPLPAPFETRFASGAHDYRLLVPASALAGLRHPTGMFFPFDGSLIDAAAQPAVDQRAGGLEILLPKASAPTSAKAAPTRATLDGVLTLHAEDGAERAFEISANLAPPSPAESGITWWQALLLAFLGGVVLNAMPCVFPILSLKLLSVAQQAHGHRAERICMGSPIRVACSRASPPLAAYSSLCAAPVRRSAGAFSCNRRFLSRCWPICCSRWG